MRRGEKITFSRHISSAIWTERLAGHRKGIIGGKKKQSDFAVVWKSFGRFIFATVQFNNSRLSLPAFSASSQQKKKSSQSASQRTQFALFLMTRKEKREMSRDVYFNFFFFTLPPSLSSVPRDGASRAKAKEETDTVSRQNGKSFFTFD